MLRACILRESIKTKHLLFFTDQRFSNFSDVFKSNCIILYLLSYTAIWYRLGTQGEEGEYKLTSYQYADTIGVEPAFPFLYIWGENTK